MYRNITERIFYRNTLPIHPKASGVVPLRGNPLLRALLQEKTKNSTNNKNK